MNGVSACKRSQVEVVYTMNLAWCQVVSPHCLVAPGYVAPTEVTSPQHRSCVAPTSKLRRPLHVLVLVVCGTASTRPKDPHYVSQPLSKRVINKVCES